jgi:MFS family permease
LDDAGSKAADAPESVAPGPYGGWRSVALLGLLLCLNVLNFVDRTLPQAFIVDIMADVKLSYTQFTLINGPLFGVVYALTGLLMGLLADRYSRPKLIGGGLVLWSGLTAATGFAGSFLQIGAARALVAVGEATLAPSALSMLSQVFTRKRRGLVTSLYYLGVSIGAGGSYIIAGTLGAAVGWRNCFIILGAAGALLALVVFLLPDPRGKAAARDPDAPPLVVPKFSQIAAEMLEALRRSAALRLVLLGAILILFGQGASVLDQAWLVNELGVPKALAQTRFGTLFLIGSVAGALVGGPLADRFARRFVSGRVLYLATIFAVVGPVSILLRYLDPASPLFTAAFLVVSAGFTLHYAGIFPSVQELAPTRVRATVIAVALLAMALLGTALGNVFAGVVADLLREGGQARPVTLAIAVTNGAILLSLPLFLAAARRYRDDRDRYGSLD